MLNFAKLCAVASMLGLAAMGSGCRSTRPPLFTASGPEWRVQEGQALWQPRKDMPQIAGELLLASHPDGRWTLQFTKTPMPMAVAQRSGERWLIEFPAAKMSFAGKGNPPGRFAWLYLKPALDGATLPKGFEFAQTNAQWSLQNTRTGERLEGFVSP